VSCLLGIPESFNGAPQPKGLVHVVLEPRSEHGFTLPWTPIREKGLRDTSSACALSAFSMVRVNETPNQIA